MARLQLFYEDYLLCRDKWKPQKLTTRLRRTQHGGRISSGNRKDTWNMRVTGNWRITFRFENGDAYDVNLEDYH